MNYLLNKTWQIDCLVGLPWLPDESVDFCLTDPPFNIKLNYNEYEDNLPPKLFWQWIEKVFSEIYRVLKPKAHLTFTSAQKQIFKYVELLESMGFTHRHVGVWHNPGRKAGSWPGMWPYSWEPVLDFTKGKYRKLNNGNSVGYMDVWVERPPTKWKHPATRPVAMWKELVELCSDEGEIVLDPFHGSGTTGEMCIKTYRNFVAFEIDSCYRKMCEERAKEVRYERGMYKTEV